MGSASSKLEQSLKVEAEVSASDERAEDDTRWRRKPKPNTELGRVPNAIEGEQVAAGLPSWLAAVAGEALNGWIPRRADTFEKIDKIGDGSYSSVYMARDVLSGKIVASKKVKFDP